MALLRFIQQRGLLTLFICTLSLSYAPTLLADSTEYNAAVKLFENKSYSEAYKAFSSLVEKDYTSINYSFYLAESATQLNKYIEAIAAYERILILEPNHTRSKLELGKLYFDLKSYALSKNYFTEAQNDQVPETVLLNISRYLDKIEQETSLGKLSGAAIIGLGFDSNVNSAPYSSSWFIPVFGADFTNTTNTVESNYHQEIGMFNYYYNGTKKYGFGINNNLLAYNKSIPGESDYNVTYLRYKPSLVFTTGEYKINAAIQYDTMRYGGEAYLESYGLVPNITHNLNTSSQLSAHLKLLKKNYLKSNDQARDANYIEAGIAYRNLLNKQTTWHLETNLIQERKESGVLTDVSYDALFIKTGMSYQYSDDIRVGVDLGLMQKNYLDKNIFFLNNRQDHNIKLALNISKILDKNLSLQASVERTQNTSNQAAYEYNKNVFLMNLIKRF